MKILWKFWKFFCLFEYLVLMYLNDVKTSQQQQKIQTITTINNDDLTEWNEKKNWTNNLNMLWFRLNIFNDYDYGGGGGDGSDMCIFLFTILFWTFKKKINKKNNHIQCTNMMPDLLLTCICIRCVCVCFLEKFFHFFKTKFFFSYSNYNQFKF